MPTTLELRRQAREAVTGLARRTTTQTHPETTPSLRAAETALEPCRLPMPLPIPFPRPRLRAKVLAPLAALMLVALASGARAARFDDSADGRLVDVRVLVDGQSAPLYAGPGGWDRRYFQAYEGRNYSLAIHNRSGERVGVLIAVDGLNVVTGERSRLSHDESMYVLDPWERTVISGWRTSLRDVRRFVFVDERRSYAERTGQANGDLGWIRVLSFREVRPIVMNERPWIGGGRDSREPTSDRAGELQGGRDQKAEPQVERAAPAPPQVAPTTPGQAGLGKTEASKQRADALRDAPESNPGTGWGERSWDPVQRTVFLAAARPTDHIILRYEYESGLRALGIFPRRHRTWEREHGELGYGFARPPKW
jgi:hypothetical protein